MCGAGWALPCASPSLLHSASCSSRGALLHVMCMGICYSAPSFSISPLPLLSAGSPRFVFISTGPSRVRESAWLPQEAMTRVLADVGQPSARLLDPERGVSSRTMSELSPHLKSRVQGGNAATLSAPRCNYSHITARGLTSPAEPPRLADTRDGAVSHGDSEPAASVQGWRC